MKKTPLKKYNKKTLEKRKESRKGYPEFYKKHIKYIKDNKICCEECGDKLLGDVSEVAHVLPKGSFPSVATLDENILYLCSWKSPNNCHGIYDNSSTENFRKLLVFEKSCRIFALIEKEIEEKINYKIYEKYEWQV